MQASVRVRTKILNWKNFDRLSNFVAVGNCNILVEILGEGQLEVSIFASKEIVDINL